MKIYRNAVQCTRCGDIVESISSHHFNTCRCGAVSVDGGFEYLRRLATDRNTYIELSVFDDDTTSHDEDDNK